MNIRDALELKYPGDRYALFFDVPDNVGLDSRRRADAIAFGMWKSVGRLIEGFEFKASRSDWLREVKQVDKADPFIERCDRWWLVTTDATIAKIEEVPACWGWLSVTPTGLRCQKPAPKLREYDNKMDRLFVLGVLRKAADEARNPAELTRRVEWMRKEYEGKIDELAQRKADANVRENKRLRDKVEAFEKSIGMGLDDWKCGQVAKIALELAKIGYDATGLDAIDNTLARNEDTLTTLLECVKLARAQIGSKA